MGLLALKAKQPSRPARRTLQATGARGSVTTRRVGSQRAWRLEIASWPEDLRDLWAERAAMIQYGDGQTREAAEYAAYLQAPAELAAWQKHIENASGDDK